jgi:hypothetical protein
MDIVRKSYHESEPFFDFAEREEFIGNALYGSSI